jgi:hypothetical protein
LEGERGYCRTLGNLYHSSVGITETHQHGSSSEKIRHRTSARFSVHSHTDTYFATSHQSTRCTRHHQQNLYRLSHIIGTQQKGTVLTHLHQRRIPYLSTYLCAYISTYSCTPLPSYPLPKPLLGLPATCPKQA